MIKPALANALKRNSEKKTKLLLQKKNKKTNEYAAAIPATSTRLVAVALVICNNPLIQINKCSGQPEFRK